jgi:Amt family ammonium transporter
MLTAIFADGDIQRLGGAQPFHGNYGGWVDKHWFQMVPQTVGVLVGAAWAFTVTSLIVLAMNKIRIPWFDGHWLSLSLRMSREDEVTGTDFALMGEVACKSSDVFDCSHHVFPKF